MRTCSVYSIVDTDCVAKAAVGPKNGYLKNMIGPHPTETLFDWFITQYGQCGFGDLAVLRHQGEPADLVVTVIEKPFQGQQCLTVLERRTLSDTLAVPLHAMTSWVAHPSEQGESLAAAECFLEFWHCAEIHAPCRARVASGLFSFIDVWVGCESLYERLSRFGFCIGRVKDIV
jgi:hypothetical protein